MDWLEDVILALRSAADTLEEARPRLERYAVQIENCEQVGEELLRLHTLLTIGSPDGPVVLPGHEQEAAD